MSINVICIWSHAPRSGEARAGKLLQQRPGHTTLNRLAANGVHQDAKPREQLHALVAAPRLRVGAIDCIVRTKEAPPSSKEYREGDAGHKRRAEPLRTQLRVTM